jgi:hypothetical protein
LKAYEEIRQEDQRLREEEAKFTTTLARERWETDRQAAAGRFEAQQEFERRLAAATEEEEVLGRHAQRRKTAVKVAERRVNEFRRDHAVRLSALSEGIDRMLAPQVDREAASEALDATLAVRAKRIVHGDPRVLDELAPALIALHPEMVEALWAVLRERLSGLADRGDCAVSGLTDEDYEERLAELKEAVDAARQEATEAKETADAAIAHRRRLERRGH